MAVLPADLTADVVLRDGSTVLLRPLSPGDAPALLTLAAQLPSGTLYTRFFATPRPPAFEIAGLLAASSDRQFALVAEAAGRLVGVACYTRNNTAAHAEVTLAVAVMFQGRGLGTLLLAAIASAARAHGIRVFDAYVLADNTRMMQVFVDSGFAVTEEPQSGVHHVMLALEPSLHWDRDTASRGTTATTVSMRAFFEPRSVAVVGANRERGKIGSELLHNIIDGGYTGSVAVVHPSVPSLDGIPAYPRLTDIPGPVDLAVICVPADQVAAVVHDSIAKGVRALIVISAGFGETGATGRASEVTLAEAVRKAGIRMVGPNCMGLVSTRPDVRLNATFSPITTARGHIAMSTQSGALGLAILEYARRLHIGFSSFISVGNKADVSNNDLLQCWAEDPDTRVIVLYLESFGNPRKFSEIARRVGRVKPIVAVKAGRSSAGAKAASSHTGSLASSDAIVDALFRQSGVIRTATIEELFDVATLLANQPVPASRRVAILTNAGGPGMLAADACEAQGLELPPLSESTADRLRSFLPPAAALGNPVDILASASAGLFGRALEVLLADRAIDSVLVIFIPPVVTDGTDVARAIDHAARTAPAKPVLTVFMSAKPAPAVMGSVPTFTFPESAARALARACHYGAWRRQPEGKVPEFADFDRPAARATVDQVLARGGGWASTEQSHALLHTCGIPVVETVRAPTEGDAVRAAERLGFPVALKAVGTRLVHKTDFDVVRLGLADGAAVSTAWRDFSRRLPDLMTGALVQPMVSGGIEMLVGIVPDETFGPVLACASGGLLTEVVGDSQFRLFPVTDLDAQTMIDSLKVARLLRGYRGRPPADEDALRDALLRLSVLAAACPEIQELDINPLAVATRGVVALDVRVRIEPVRAKPLPRRVMY